MAGKTGPRHASTPLISRPEVKPGSLGQSAFENHPMVVNLESLHLKDSTEDNRNNGMQCIASADREASGRQSVKLIHSVFTESLLSIS